MDTLAFLTYQDGQLPISRSSKNLLEVPETQMGSFLEIPLSQTATFSSNSSRTERDLDVVGNALEGNLLSNYGSTIKNCRRSSWNANLRSTSNSSKYGVLTKADSSPFLMEKRKSLKLLPPIPRSTTSSLLPLIREPLHKRGSFPTAFGEPENSLDKLNDLTHSQKSPTNGESHLTRDHSSDHLVHLRTISKDSHVEIVRNSDFKSNESDIAIFPSFKKRGSMCITELWSKKERLEIAEAIISKYKKGELRPSKRVTMPCSPMSDNSAKMNSGLSTGDSSPHVDSDKEAEVTKVCSSLTLLEARYYLITTMLPELKRDYPSLEEKISVVTNHKVVYEQQELKLLSSQTLKDSQSSTELRFPKFPQAKQKFKVRKSLRCDSKSTFFLSNKAHQD